MAFIGFSSAQRAADPAASLATIFSACAQRHAGKGVLALLLLGGCASLPEPSLPPHEHAPVAAADVLPDTEWSRELAAQMALQHHPALQAAQAQWQAEQAQARQMLRLPNPALSVARQRTRSPHGDGFETEWETELGVHLPLGQWLAAWLRADERRQTSEHAQTLAQAQWLLQLDQGARAARRAWVEAVGAEQLRREYEAALEAAQTAAELARRLQAVGNFSKLQALRWEQAHAQMQLHLAQAQRQAEQARAQLAQHAGVWQVQGIDALRLPAQLPALPEHAPEDSPGEAQALSDRLDLRVARADAALQLARLGVVQPERWLAGVEVNLERGRATGPDGQAQHQRMELSLPLPVLDDGRFRNQAVQARAQAAAWTLQARSQAVRAQVREAERALKHAWEQARHHQTQLVPLQQQISDEMLLRWNGMLEGPFELLRDAQARLGAQRAATMALRDFWLAWERARQARWSPPDERGATAPFAPGSDAAAPTDTH